MTRRKPSTISIASTSTYLPTYWFYFTLPVPCMHACQYHTSVLCTLYVLHHISFHHHRHPHACKTHWKQRELYTFYYYLPTPSTPTHHHSFFLCVVDANYLLFIPHKERPSPYHNDSNKTLNTEQTNQAPSSDMNIPHQHHNESARPAGQLIHAIHSYMLARTSKYALTSTT